MFGRKAVLYLVLPLLLVLVPAGARALMVSKSAPLFTASSNQGEISLENYAGKKYLILSFYFNIDTPDWKRTVLAFKRDMEQFESYNVQVLGVSSDSMETLNRFADEYGISFPLIPDERGKLKSLYSKMRISYLIDQNGTIRLIQRGVPDNVDLLKKIRAIETADEG